MKKTAIATIVSLALFLTFNAWAQTNNSLVFNLGQTSVQKGNDSLEMGIPLFKIGSEHFVSMEFLSKNLDGITLDANEDMVTFSINKEKSEDDPSPPNPDPEKKFDVEKLVEDLVKLINGHRKDVGAPPVEIMVEVAGVAYAHSEDMCERYFFDHVNPDGKDPGDRLDDAGIDWIDSAENIQKLAFSEDLAEKIDKGFQSSPDHKKNRETKKFSKIGLGIVSCGNNVYVTELFITQEDTKPIEVKNDLKMISASYWKTEATKRTFMLVTFKNIGKTNLTKLFFPIAVEDKGKEVDCFTFMFFGILEPGQCHTQSFVLEEGIELSKEALIKYTIDYQTSDDKQPEIQIENAKFEKMTSSLRFKGKATNKSKNDYYLFIYPQFFNMNGDSLVINDVGIVGIKEFKAGKTYDFSGGTIYTPPGIVKTTNHYELSYWFTTPEEYLNYLANLNKKQKIVWFERTHQCKISKIK
jgi:uncharacterized protein YkwD